MFSRRLTSSSKGSSSFNLNVEASEFLEAINQNDIEKAKSYINSLKIWQIKDENGLTPLHYSVFRNNYDLTTIIINEVKKGLGISSNKISNFINEKTNEGFTALHYAVNNGNLLIVQLLKQYGAKFEAVTNLGKNAVHIAAEANQVTMLMYLILNEALDIFCLDENGSTPLHWACYSGAFEAVDYLLSLKADINAQDKERITPLFLAVDNKRENIVRILLMNGADKNLPNKKNELPINIARKKNYVRIKNLLKDKEYNPLCTLESPPKYIEPSNIYRKLILFLIIIVELIIFILILPFLEDIYHLFVNLGSFALCLLSFIIFMYKDPGYQKNTKLIKDCGGEKNNKPLKTLLDIGMKLENYCPKCYIEKKKNITHCFICDECVLEMSHHCFWINKCIGKNNKFFYLLFIFFSFIFALESIFICSNLIFDTVTIPYIKSFFPSWIYFDIDRGFRVLGAAIVLVLAFLISFPLFFLFMIEMFKLCGLLGKKFYEKNKMKELGKIDIDEDKKINLLEEKENKINLNNKKINEIIIEDKNLEENNNSLDNEEKEYNINTKEENESSFKLPEENFPLADLRPSDANI
jgi:palmitoyltransferase